MTPTEINAAKTALLKLSRKVPYRAGSPYGYLSCDNESIKDTARKGYEALAALIPDGEKR